MKCKRFLQAVNLVFPVVEVGLEIFQGICDTAGSYLQGTLMGLDLKWSGPLFMAVLLGLAPLPTGH